jgi:hypothetical protein
MAHVTRLAVHAATIEAGPGYLGAVEHSTGGLNAAAAEARSPTSTWPHDRNGMVAMAGAIAEWVVTEEIGHRGLGGDRKFVDELALNRFPQEQTGRAWVEYLWHRGIDILVSLLAWPCVESLASVLMVRRSLTASETRDAIFRNEMPDAKETMFIDRKRIALHQIKCPFLYRVGDR